MGKFDYLDIVSVVERLMSSKESAEIEFKSAAGGFPRSFWETYSSFANTQGGTIVLGIKEKDGEYSIDNLTVVSPSDSRILENYTFDDIDKSSLEQYRRLFDLAKPGHAWLTLNGKDLLKKLGGFMQ